MFGIIISEISRVPSAPWLKVPWKTEQWLHEESSGVGGQSGLWQVRFKAKPCRACSEVWGGVSLTRCHISQGAAPWTFPVGWAPFRSFSGTNLFQFHIHAGKFEPEVRLRPRAKASGLLWLASSWVFPLEPVLSRAVHSQSGYGNWRQPSRSLVPCWVHRFPGADGARWHLAGLISYF